MIEPQIIHEDESIIVIDKPAGTPSVSLKKNEKGTVASWLLEKFPELKNISNGELESGLLHRLDNDTSGVIVAAKDQFSYDTLKRQFDTGIVSKTYFAIVLGNPPQNGAIDSPIAHHPRKKKKMIICSSQKQAAEQKAQNARTEFQLEKRIELKTKSRAEYALLKVEIKTGARHQIRVHLAAAGFPIAGDKLYQNSEERAADALGAERHLLHAGKIEFRHPKTGRAVSFSSSVPDDMQQVVMF